MSIKMKFRNLFFFFALIALFLFLNQNIYAVENPLSAANNKFGIHILFPEEISEAAKLINSSGGDWGYVVIPIQASDKKIEKWQKFMDEAKKLHIIPIIRIATEGDYFNKKVWRKANFEDVLDFANFLSSLNWPIKNRYILIFNEPNNQWEWGGEVNPLEYAQILSYAVDVFKAKSNDFFIISAGLDNAAANKSGSSMNEYDFLKQMKQVIPDIFSKIDGFGSHSYPNPAFSQPPSIQTSMSITSFKYEKELILGFGRKDLMIFITETGWPTKSLSENQIASYFKEAFESVWNDNNIITVAPFLLRANEEPFIDFSFLRNETKTEQYKTIENFPKIKGAPVLLPKVLGEKTKQVFEPPVKNFDKQNQNSKENKYFTVKTVKAVAKWLLKIE